MSKENILRRAKEAKEIWDNKLSKSSKNTFAEFFHIRPTSSGFTIVSTNSEKPMNGNNKINSCSKLEKLITICNEELEKENINWNRLGIEGEYKKTEADIQAWLINVINNHNNKFDLYYQELTSALEVNENIENMIDIQTNIKKLSPYIENKQDENIKILKKNGEYYNLLDATNKN